jgi:prepilin peptidase CpaA
LSQAEDAHILALLAFAILLLWAAGEDMRRLIIPNWISLAVVGLYPVFALTSPAATDWLLAAGTAALVLLGGFMLFAVRLMGGGDVKLMAAVALWAGPGRLPLLISVTAIVGGVVAAGLLVIRWVRSRRQGRDAGSAVMPYGVAIAAGGLAVALSLSKGG